MAAANEIRIAFLCALFSLGEFASDAETIVEVSVRGEPIILGGLLVVQCQMWGLKERSIVNFELNKPDGSVTQLATGNEVRLYLSDVTERHFLSTRRFIDGSIVHFFTITHVSSADEGSYTCTSISTVQPVTIVPDSKSVRLHHFPNTDRYPLCTGAPNNPVILSENNVVVLTCSSDIGNPPVNMSWHYGLNADSANISNRQWIEDGQMFSEMTYTLQMANQWAMFVCQISSDMFPGLERMCQIGPLAVVPGDTQSMVTVAQSSVIGNPVTPPPADTAIGESVGSCPKQSCTTTSRSNKFYILTLTTVATTLLCLIFAAATIYLCHKVHVKEKLLKSSTSTVVRRRPPGCRGRGLPSQPADTVYVKMQRNSVGGTEPLYMTLEPPIIPSSLSRPNRPSSSRQSSTENAVVLPMLQAKDISSPTSSGSRSNRASVVIPKEFLDRYTVTLPKNSVIKMKEYSDKISSIE